MAIHQSRIQFRSCEMAGVRSVNAKHVTIRSQHDDQSDTRLRESSSTTRFPEAATSRTTASTSKQAALPRVKSPIAVLQDNCPAVQHVLCGNRTAWKHADE